MEKHIVELISKESERIINRKFEKYESVCETFKRFFHSEDLVQQWDNKADVIYVNQRCDENASKLDFVEMKRLMESIYKRIQHLSIIQTEIARAIVPIKSSGSF